MAPRVIEPLLLVMVAIITTQLLGCEPPPATQEVRPQASPTIRPTLPMPTLAHYEKEGAAEIVQFLEIWPESGVGRVSGYTWSHQA